MNVLVAFLLLIILIIAVMPLLVLFIALCIKKPKLIAILALVPIVLVLFFVFPKPHSTRVNYDGIEHVNQRFNQYQYSSSPIWSLGIGEQFEADVYPSKIAAVRGLDLLVNKTIWEMAGSFSTKPKITIFQEVSDPILIQELKKTIEQSFQPEPICTIEAQLRNLLPDEIGITMWVVGQGTKIAPWSNLEDIIVTSGIIQANVMFHGDRLIQKGFVEKPWVEDFSSFINSQPDKQYIVAKSNEICLSPEEADRQAMDDANQQVCPRLLSYLNPNRLENKDILESGMIIDKFVQSFDGSAGKIWRQAILLDVSPGKIAGVTQAGRERRLSTVGSIAGLFVLITIVYIFLNAATRGYYAWSLRIAGVVLALILIFLLFA